MPDVEPTGPHEGRRRPVDRVVFSFERALREGRDPAIEDYLSEATDRRRVLVELVHSDLELRLRDGRPVRLSDYLSRYPELIEEPDELAAILETEIRTRAGRGESPSCAEYEDEYPFLGRRVRAAFRRAGLAPPEVPGCEVECELGRGGMGVVYKARDVKLKRTVAVKMVLGARAGPNEVARFLAEAEAVAAVEHPNVVRVFGFGEADGHPYMILEYLPGGTLAGRLKGKRLDPAEVAVLVGKVARGMAAVHRLGIVHRDLKPGNVLFDAAGEPKVADFGLARRGGGGDLTGAQAVMGTLPYMPPEQAKGESKFVGPTADVWALGVILYELLAGRRPFAADTPEGLVAAILTADPTRPRGLAPAVPRDLELICLKCLAKDPRDRYPTAQELADDLDALAAGRPISARPAGTVERAVKWVRRNKVVSAAAAAVVLALTVGGGVSVAFGLDARAKEKTARDEYDRAERERNEALRANDELNTALAAAILSSIGIQGPDFSITPQEVDALWQLALRRGTVVGERFPLEALKTALGCEQLARRPNAVHANLGLDLAARDRLDRAVAELLARPDTPDGRRAPLALFVTRSDAFSGPVVKQAVKALAEEIGRIRTGTRVEELTKSLAGAADRAEDPATAAEVAAGLRSLFDRATDQNARRQLGIGIATVSRAMDPRRASELLADLLDKTTDSIVETAWADALLAAARRLPPEESATVLTRGVVVLTAAAGRTTDTTLLGHQLRDLVKFARAVPPGHHRPEFLEAVSPLAAAMRGRLQRGADYVGNLYAECLAALATRGGPACAAAAAGTLADAPGIADPGFAGNWAVWVAEAAAHAPPADAEAALARATDRFIALLGTGKKPGPAGPEVYAGPVLERLTAARSPEAAVATLTAATARTTRHSDLAALGRAIARAARRLPPEEAAGPVTVAAAAVSRGTEFGTVDVVNLPAWCSALAALAELAELCPPADASELRRTVVDRLSRFTSGTPLPGARRVLASEGMAVAAALPPEDRRELCGNLAAALADVFPLLAPPATRELPYLADVLARLAPHAPPEVAEAACLRAISALAAAGKTEPAPGSHLLDIPPRLAALAAWVRPADAEAPCRELTEFLLGELERTPPTGHFAALARAIAALAPLLPEKESVSLLSRLAEKVTTALGLAEEQTAPGALAEALFTVLSKMPREEAVAAAARSRASLAAAPVVPGERIERTTVVDRVAARGGWMDPRRAAVVLVDLLGRGEVTYLTDNSYRPLACAIRRVRPADVDRGGYAGAMAAFASTGPNGLASALPLLHPELHPRLNLLPPQALVELLKHPFCVGGARRVVLDGLGEHYGRRFADQWEFARFARDNASELDLTSPPGR